MLGRWEIGNKAVITTDGGSADIPASVADPECESTKELDLLPWAFGSDYAARYSDRQIRTSGEQTAVQLVERSGIVLPSCMIPGLGDGGVAGSAKSLGDALVAQLVLEEQVQNNLQSAPPSSAALNNVLAGVADGDIVFAFQRALRTWELLTNTADPTGPGGTLSCAGLPASPLLSNGALPAGLLMATYPPGWPQTTSNQPLIHANVGQLLGIVVKGGLSRSRLATDPIARAGGMTEASQCADGTTRWDEWGNPTATIDSAIAASGTQPYAYVPPVAFQDAFHLGQAFERRLNLLQTAAAPVTAYQDPVNVAKGGIAELRSWAGATIVHAWPQGSTSDGTWTSFVARVSGMSYAHDFGLANPGDGTTVSQAFGFVYGPPWMAECAAGVRADCPSGLQFVQNYVQTSPAVAFQDVSSEKDVSGHPYSASGVLDSVFELTVPLVGGAPFFNRIDAQIPVTAPGQTPAPAESHLYMVLLTDPTSPTGKGRVLGTIPLYGGMARLLSGGHLSWQAFPQVTGFVDAPMQRELVHDAIDLGSWVGARPPALGDLSAAQSSGYCVDGVPRNLFVPLDNELVSGTQTYEDSWQAYLSLAQTAAQAADTSKRPGAHKQRSPDFGEPASRGREDSGSLRRLRCLELGDRWNGRENYGGSSGRPDAGLPRGRAGRGTGPNRRRVSWAAARHHHRPYEHGSDQSRDQLSRGRGSRCRRAHEHARPV